MSEQEKTHRKAKLLIPDNAQETRVGDSPQKQESEREILEPLEIKRKSLNDHPQQAAATREVVHIDQILSGRYRLKREIARGGMGIVYEAIDELLEDHPVAIKVLPEEMSTNQAAILRLKKEALSAIQLTHPNIMRLHSFEEDGSIRYLVMELLDGQNLEIALAVHETLELEEVLEIARQVSAGLMAAHAAGIIHRDIKPANLMYKVVNGKKVLKIADFGIAHQIKNSMSRLTSTSSSLTPLYAAPEQIKAEKLDVRCDQYSFAITLYELLNGAPPFGGVALEFQILNAIPQDLKNVPNHINAAIQRALSKDREDRFSSCEAFIAALDNRSSVIKNIVDEIRVRDNEEAQNRASLLAKQLRKEERIESSTLSALTAEAVNAVLPERAIEKWKKVLEFDKTHRMAESKIFKLEKLLIKEKEKLSKIPFFIESGQFSNAVSLIHKAIELVPERKETKNLLAETIAASEKYTSAKTFALQSLQASHFDDANLAIREALDLCPRSSQAQKLYSVISLKAKKKDNTILVFFVVSLIIVLLIAFIS
jgi:serine/threonine protein kinase